MATATKNPSVHGTVSLEPSVVAARDVSSYQHSPTWPDIRGWEVLNAGGDAVGVVDRLLIDPSMHKIRYLSVEVQAAKGTPSTHTLVPVGAAKVERGKNRVQLSSKASASWGQLTQATTELITRDTEIAVLQALGVAMMPTEPRSITYTSPLFDPKMLFEPTAGSQKT